MPDSFGELSRVEKSLLTYLETRAVDYAGRINLEQVNAQEIEIMEGWQEIGLLDFGRIKIANQNRDGTHWVLLSDTLIDYAQHERRERIKRMWDKRRYETVNEPKLENAKA